MASRPAAARRRNAQVRRVEARDRIAAATEELLAHQPYRELSVDAVMRAAGLSRTAFYRHYDGLPEVVLELYGAVTDGLADAVAEQDLHGTLRAAVDAFAAHGPVMRAVHEAAGQEPAIEAAERSVTDAFTATMARMLAEAMDAGHVARGDAGELARALNLMNYHYLLATVAADPAFDADAAYAALAAVWEAVAPGSTC